MTNKQKKEEEKKFYNLIPQKYRKFVDRVEINEDEWIDGQIRKIYYIYLAEGYEGDCGNTGYCDVNRSEVLKWLREMANKLFIPWGKVNQ